MINKEKNKMLDSPEVEFHFAGAGAHPPITIKAPTRADAERILQERLKPETKKVEPLKEEDNKK